MAQDGPKVAKVVACAVFLQLPRCLARVFALPAMRLTFAASARGFQIGENRLRTWPAQCCHEVFSVFWMPAHISACEMPFPHVRPRCGPYPRATEVGHGAMTLHTQEAV